MWFLQEDSMNEQEIKEQLCDVCHKMWQLGWVAANDGNVSVKLGDDTFFATPTGMSKSFITPDKLVRINDKGEVPEAIKPYLQEHDVMLLQNHGALTVGADLITAYYRMETLELFAKISLNAHLLGGAQEISRENIDRLCSMRAQYGVTGKHPGYKKYPNGQN